MQYLEQLMFVAGAIFLCPDIRDLRSIGVQGKLPWQRICDDGHSAPRNTGVLFDNRLDSHVACRMAWTPPTIGVDRTH
jgi:hypothetical protein